ncbi:ABC transporter ATP-binding protein [Tropicimonas isoalkanivorans]|uniref:ABC-type multidrug transport system, ATPase and permease component n=1 Tax=Tropicimonas isoalkanivorans TaxID=441112 RepID=A0A1I1DRX1_9RHOB|nr:ABC transporter ATP-binding protein [Tropicimonas isoalkanivorans]SFB77641.1 ABC-type multidrug transport system, ATPase and permease component [Tropicimonas isoalkanivorans]
MISRHDLRRAWALLDAHERRNALKVLALMIVAAFASAVMIGSVFPFLSVLSDPDLIDTVPLLHWSYQTLGFDSKYTFIVTLGLAAIVLIVLSNIVLILSTWANLRFSQMRTHSISRRLLAHYLAQGYGYFLTKHTGDLATTMLAESSQVVNQFFRPLANFISASLTSVAVISTVVLIEPVVATSVIVTFGLIYCGLMVTTRRYLRRLGQLRTESNSRRFRYASEALNGIKDVKLLGHEATYLDRYSHPSLEMARSQVAVSVLSEAPRYAIQIVAFGGIIIVCLLLLDPSGLEDRAALSGILPIIGLLAFAGQRLMPELQKLYSAITAMTYGGAALNRVYNDLNDSPSHRLVRTQPAPLGLKRSLVLDDVQYTYPNAERPGLRGVSLDIRAGERIGFVGSSGAGKTTLVDVVLGLLTPDSGAIHVDGTQLTSDNIRAWQRSVGYVPQDIFLIDASLAENIALGVPPEKIDAQRVEQSARAAHLHDFVMGELPEGYATRIGERGLRLSGGQRQRIGIARALYRDTDLIAFDEATSALDNLTEREVLSAVETLPGDKTILMIAHRLSTVKVCDRIVVMDGGRIADVGTWDELIRYSDAFSRIAGDAA